MRGKTIFQAILSLLGQSSLLASGQAIPATSAIKNRTFSRTLDEFLKEAEQLLIRPMDSDGMLRFSRNLKAQIRYGAQNNPACMLPSYNHQLPNGLEKGKYLSVDMGGTMLRIAVVELKGNSEMNIISIISWKVENAARRLEGRAFFDWLAEKILFTVSKGISDDHDASKPLPLALAWSFPVEYVVSIALLTLLTFS